MRKNGIIGALAWMLAASAACTDAQNDCNRNPELACFAQGGAGGSTTSTTTSTGGTPACGTPGGDKCDGAPCAAAAECESGYCVDGVCCEKACEGACQACSGLGADGTCAALPMGTLDESSPTGETCAGKGGCGETLGYCACEDGILNGDEVWADCGGSCAPCNLGAPCGGVDANCASGLCVTGVCCDTPCDSPCQACGLPQSLGVCSPVPAATQGPGCGAVTEACSAQGACAKASGEACAGAPECASALCSGGVCATCLQMSDCPVDQVCVSGACAQPGTEGLACPSDLACKSGYCVDGVCCAEVCDGLCMGCHVAYTGQTSGVCAPVLAGFDPYDECVGTGKAGTCSGEAAGPAVTSDCGAP